MRILPNLIRGLGCVCLVCTAAMGYACDRIPAGETLWVRLTAPITTYTAKPGDAVHAVLTEDVVCDNEVVLPMGAAVDGVVRSKHKVGWGFRYETAALDIEFTKATARPGVALDMTARVEGVESARENVHNGVIQGIRATATFEGSVNSRLIHFPTWNPYSDLILITYKATFPIFPEPEIYYPAGTDMRLETTKEISLPPGMAAAAPVVPPVDPPATEGERQLVAQMPLRVTNTRHVNADLLTMVFVGSESQVQSAFHHAGWNGADPHSAGAWGKNLYALLNNSGYPRQPMMKFLMNGKPEDMDWQQDLNSYGRRDHLRLWRWTGEDAAELVAAPRVAAGPAAADRAAAERVAGERVWVASCTHDTSAVFSVKHFRFMHHVAPHIDNERSTVVRDLTFAGCVKSVSYVQRPEPLTSVRNTIGDTMITDGDVAVVTLQDCRPVFPEADLRTKPRRFKPGNIAFRYVRRQVLGYRNDVLRANLVFAIYTLARVAVMPLHRKPVVLGSAKPAPPQTPARTGVAATR